MEFIKALEEEKKKVLVFEKELPLSLQIVSQAIETFKLQLNIDVGENIASEVPVLEKFIPLRPTYSSSSSEDKDINKNNNDSTIKINDGSSSKIPDWLRSAQLWNEQPEPTVEPVRKPIAMKAKKAGGALLVFGKEKGINTVVTSSTSNINAIGGGLGDGPHMEERNRKARRSWSAELHRRFLNALQELGGCNVATPKMIKELMKVDGLTNNEVKSHLQKYRLHSRKPMIYTVKTINSDDPQQPQIILVRDKRASPSEYSISVTTSKSDTAIASIASQTMQQQQNEQQQNTSPTSPFVDLRLGNSSGYNKNSHERSQSCSNTTGSSMSMI